MILTEMISSKEFSSSSSDGYEGAITIHDLIKYDVNQHETILGYN